MESEGPWTKLSTLKLNPGTLYSTSKGPVPPVIGGFYGVEGADWTTAPMQKLFAQRCVRFRGVSPGFGPTQEEEWEEEE